MHTIPTATIVLPYHLPFALSEMQESCVFLLNFILTMSYITCDRIVREPDRYYYHNLY